MARVRRAKRTVTILGRTRRTSRANIAALVKDVFVTATTEQLRVTAEEAHELILDRLYAAAPQKPVTSARTGPVPEAQKVIARPRPIRGQKGDTFDVGPLIKGRRAVRHKHLRQWWVRYKARRSQDGRKLIATGPLTHSLEIFKGKQGGLTYYILRPIEDVHNTGRGNISYRKLWKVHEFGSRSTRVPKRPIWGPVAEQIAQAINSSRYRQRLKASALRASLRRIA